MNISPSEFVRLIETARNLSEPGEPNDEYVRGQVNLIHDYAGLPGETDNYYNLLRYVIAHDITLGEFMFEVGGLVQATLEAEL